MKNIRVLNGGIFVEARPGVLIDTACREAADLATYLNITVTLDFNGTCVDATPGITWEAVADGWYRQRNP